MRSISRHLCWAALCFLALLGCQVDVEGPSGVTYPQDLEAGEVPISFQGQGEAALVVPVYVNGEGPYDFILDTGATLTCVTEPLAEALALPEPPGAVGVGAGVGGAGRVQIVRIDSLRVGEASASGLSGCVLDLAHLPTVGVEVDGLLGLNFLREFRMTLDFGRNTLTLEEPG